MTTFLNGEPVCRSIQLYGTQTTDQHINAVGVCKAAGDVRKGDILWAVARYDPVLYPLVMHHGRPDPVMGSMGVYIGVDDD